MASDKDASSSSVAKDLRPMPSAFDMARAPNCVFLNEQRTHFQYAGAVQAIDMLYSDFCVASQAAFLVAHERRTRRHSTCRSPSSRIEAFRLRSPTFTSRSPS